jgi:DNA replicative helicase MCM subunit Mcm2 (Cdc46/Mcm family)
MYARRINPVLSDEAKEMLTEYYIELATNHHVSPRFQETLFRLAKAMARLKLKNIVDTDDAKETMQFYNTIMLQYQQVVKIPESPKYITYIECVDILKMSKVAISFEELLRKVCQRNEQSKNYLGYDLKIRKNGKARAIYKMLLNHTSIKQV